MNLHPNDYNQNMTSENTCRTMILYNNPESIIKNKRYNENAHSKNQCRTMILYQDPRSVLIKNVNKPGDWYMKLLNLLDIDPLADRTSPALKLLNTLLVLSGFALLGSLGSKIMHDREQTNAAAEILNGLKELTHLMDNIREEWDISFAELENIFNENRAGKESLKRENRSLY